MRFHWLKTCTRVGLTLTTTHSSTFMLPGVFGANVLSLCGKRLPRELKQRICQWASWKSTASLIIICALNREYRCQIIMCNRHFICIDLRMIVTRTSTTWGFHAACKSHLKNVLISSLPFSKAFPALRLFKDSTAQSPDYRNDRTLDAMLEFLKQRLSTDEQVANMHPAAQGKQHRSFISNTVFHVIISMYVYGTHLADSSM